MIVVAVLVVLALVGVGAWVVNRREGDEVHSVEGYRHTLDTLQCIRSKSASASVRVLGPPGGGAPGPTAGGPDRAGDDGADRVTPATPGRAIGHRGEVVLEDPTLSDPGPGSMSLGRRDRAMTAMNRRPRRLAAPILVGVVVLAVLGLVILAGARSQNPHKASGTVATTSPPSATQASSPGVGSRTTTSTAAHGKTKAHVPAPTAPSTTRPPANFTALTSTATTATYRPPAATYSLTLSTPNGQCWVDVASGGSTVFTKTMLAGQQQSLSASGTTTIVLGAPGAVTVELDHLPVVLPANYQSPFTLTLAP